MWAEWEWRVGILITDMKYSTMECPAGPSQALWVSIVENRSEWRLKYSKIVPNVLLSRGRISENSKGMVALDILLPYPLVLAMMRYTKIYSLVLNERNRSVDHTSPLIAQHSSWHWARTIHFWASHGSTKEQSKEREGKAKKRKARSCMQYRNALDW